MNIKTQKEQSNGQTQTQILYLKKNCEKIIQSKNNKKDIIIGFKLNKMSYLNVKNKKYIVFGYGKVPLTSNNDINYINFYFHDSSLKLRFQGLIYIKITSFSLDINKNNCIKINKIIGIISNKDDLDDAKTEKILTDIYLYFNSEDDVKNFFNCINYF